MESMKAAIERFFGEIAAKEVNKYICEGCGEEVTVKESTVIAGPDKGKPFQRATGCKCWELEQSREAKERHNKIIGGGAE